MSERIALISGANKGIGFEVARQLGGAGIAVLVGSRDTGRGEEAVSKLSSEGVKAQLVQLDVTDPDSIDGAARRIDEQFQRLDILVNNAGIMLDLGQPPSQVELATLRSTFDTNVFGAFALTRAMWPLLLASEAGRIVNVSSTLGSFEKNNDPSWEFAAAKILAYNTSKAALNMMTVQLAYELRDSPVKINTACPGFVATDMNQHRGTRSVEEGAAILTQLATLPADGPSGGFFDDSGPVDW